MQMGPPRKKCQWIFNDNNDNNNDDDNNKNNDYT